MAARPDKRIVFQAGSRIGFAAAEDDEEFLKDCYIDMGQVTQALNTEDPGSILLGRTGSGKSAALLHIESTERHIIKIDPEDLALGYISNSNVLNFFHALGVDLDIFFQLLWRHVLCVQLLNYHYHVRSKSDFEKMLDVIRSIFGDDESKRLAVDYLTQWGTEFWEEAQNRIREIVEKFERELSAGIDLGSLGVPVNAQGSSKVSSEKKHELVHAATRVVNSIQIRQLSRLMDVMAEDIFTDPRRKYFVLIDRLDEKWIDDELRYRLIRALIETIKAFRKVRTVKIVVCLRVDLLERVYKYTRSSGFQEEKYEDFNLPIRWSDHQLFNVVDLRMKSLFKKRYTSEGIGFYGVFPPKYRQNGPSFDYLVQRTQFRPRDIISFVNEVMSQAVGRTAITANIIDEAEGEYSKKRLAALCTEWKDEHPYLDILLEALRGLPTRFDLHELSEATLDATILRLTSRPASPDRISDLANEYMNDKISFRDFRGQLLSILYHVGAVGVRPRINDPVCYSYLSDYIFRPEDLDDNSRLSIAPMLWRAMGSYRGKKRGEMIE
jgi:hypothetical protein